MKLLATAVGVAALVGIGIAANALVAARTKAVHGDPSERAEEARPLPVDTTELISRSSIEVLRTFTGTVEPRRRADLAFEGDGRVLRVLVEEGDRVEQGALLAELDTEQLLARRAEVESRRVRLQAVLDELEAGPRTEVVDSAKAEVDALEQELELSELLRDRRIELAKRGSIGSEELDTIQTQVRTVGARLTGARARLAELENGTRTETIAAQRGAIGEVDAALASIDVQIARAQLVAPFDGTIAARLLDEGAVVSQMMPQPAMTIVETGALEARIGLPSELVETCVSTPRGMRLTVRGNPVTTRGLRPLPTVEAGTRTVPMVFELDGDTLSPDVRPGDVVTATIPTVREQRGAWLPLSALTESTRGLWSAYAVQPTTEGPATHRTVRVELEVLHVEGDRAYVRGTFEDRDLVVSSGAHRLVPGQAVVLVDVDSAIKD
ncbi:MAG: biotin/lipoyl-binding protein [Planctomycetota bacterium]